MLFPPNISPPLRARASRRPARKRAMSTTPTCLLILSTQKNKSQYAAILPNKFPCVYQTYNINNGGIRSSNKSYSANDKSDDTADADGQVLL